MIILDNAHHQAVLTPHAASLTIVLSKAETLPVLRQKAPQVSSTHVSHSQRSKVTHVRKSLRRKFRCKYNREFFVEVSTVKLLAKAIDPNQ